jgi:hypothetical protein
MKKDAASFVSRWIAAFYKPVKDVWLIWLALSIVTTLPYMLAILRAPTGHRFSGVLSAYDDTFTYFAWIRQSADGHLSLRDLFTSEPQPGQFFLPLWTVIGFIARVTGWSPALSFHVVRVFAALVLLIAARTTALTVMKSRTRVRYTLWVYAISGGLGWLIYWIKGGGEAVSAASISGSVDLTTPEAIAFRSVFAQVHFVIGTALLACSITSLQTAIEQKRISRAASAGVLVSLLALIHPYMVVVAISVVFVTFLVYPWLAIGREIRPSLLSRVAVAAAFGAGALPGVAYLLYLNRTSEVLREWLRVTDTFSPGPQEYLLGFGIIAALAVVGACLCWKSRANYGRLLLIWAIVQTALLYAPLSFQRRLVEGLQLPLVLLASIAVFWIARRFMRGGAERYRKAWFAAVIAISSVTNIGFITVQLVSHEDAGSTDSRRYLPVDLMAAFDFMRAKADTDAVLFSHYLTGNVAPSMTGLRVFLGHYGQTIASDAKGAQVTAFYSGELDDAVARQLFERNDVGFVIYGPFERADYVAFVPPRWLRLAKRFGEVDVYEVERGSRSQ